MPRPAWTHQMFISWTLKNRPDYEVIGQYINNYTKIEIRHKICNRVWSITPSDFKGNRGCKYCFGHNKITHQEFLDWANINRPDYTIIGQYINTMTKIEIKHLLCGNSWNITPCDFKHYVGCSYCFGNNKITHQEFLNWVKINRSDYEVIGQYINNSTKIEIRHKICNNVSYVVPSNFKQGSGCYYCCVHKKITHDEFVSWALDNRADYTIIGQYINNYTKIEIKHNICGINWIVAPFSFKIGNGCPTCSKLFSKAETELFKCIKQKFPDAEHRVRGILESKKLELDIYVPSLNKAIELNGEHWHLDYPDAILRDIRKNKECIDKNIKLLTIWYLQWKKNKYLVIKDCLDFLMINK